MAGRVVDGCREAGRSSRRICTPGVCSATAEVGTGFLGAFSCLPNSWTPTTDGSGASMKPVETEKSDVTLVLEGAGDLPAEKIELIHPDDESNRSPGFETTWVPDDGERRALMNGAHVLLRVWGAGHPPVSLQVGEPPEAGDRALAAQYTFDHIVRAFGHYQGMLAQRIKATGHFGLTARELEELAARALTAAREPRPTSFEEQHEALDK
jgi:hypothetical protein